jgi:hypothetical protein
VQTTGSWAAHAAKNKHRARASRSSRSNLYSGRFTPNPCASAREKYVVKQAQSPPRLALPTRISKKHEANNKIGTGGEWFVRTLKQTCSQDYPRAPLAFKDSMIHVFCNSHYVSHFAAFFIDVGAKISSVTSCLKVFFSLFRLLVSVDHGL